jgi:uncharacterized RDD family membrane protein YckC
MPFLFFVGVFAQLTHPNLPDILSPHAVPLLVVWYGLYYWLCEWLMRGRSLAKFLTGTRVIDEANLPPSSTTCATRALLRLTIVDVFTYLFWARGLHDKATRTRVVVNRAR